jgi:hypothetical protein
MKLSRTEERDVVCALKSLRPNEVRGRACVRVGLRFDRVQVVVNEVRHGLGLRVGLAWAARAALGRLVLARCLGTRALEGLAELLQLRLHGGDGVVPRGQLLAHGKEGLVVLRGGQVVRGLRRNSKYP